VNLKTELKMLSVLLELLLKKVLSQVVVLLFFMLKELSTALKEQTLTRILESKLLKKPVKFLARPFAKTLALKDLLL
jgi:hypothetical protein